MSGFKCLVERRNVAFFRRCAMLTPMARTVVRVELEFAQSEAMFSNAMSELGFVRTVKGRTSRENLRLPSGMYLIERTSALEALELTRQAARRTKVRARIFCVPVGGAVRFGNLQRDDRRAGRERSDQAT
ncbi:MAG: hypothetical protein E6J90_11585 [Deltaproteobacteria bacterium]|nr:MAG: hypothetical protein E6J91_20110 [Deltaproteobacteria bacterium]TMQ22912.1 MAG: hypothetical protein E6J90_11585 [Deltaproteobacteria bacterium]